MRIQTYGRLWLAFMLCLPLAAQADVLGFEAGAEQWHAAPDGWVRDERGNRVDLDDDLDLDDEPTPGVWAALEHPLPLLPNLKLGFTDLQLSGSNRLNRAFTVDGTRYQTDERVRSRLRLQQYDLILYYELLDNWLNLDVGVNVKLLDGELRVRSRSGGRERVEFSGPLPMLYGRVQLDIPNSRWHTGVEASALRLGDSSLSDVRAHVGYRFGDRLDVRAGWRRQRLKLDDMDDVEADLTVDGPYVGVSFAF